MTDYGPVSFFRSALSVQFIPLTKTTLTTLGGRRLDWESSQAVLATLSATRLPVFADFQINLDFPVLSCSFNIKTPTVSTNFLFEDLSRWTCHFPGTGSSIKAARKAMAVPCRSSCVPRRMWIRPRQTARKAARCLEGLKCRVVIHYCS